MSKKEKIMTPDPVGGLPNYLINLDELGDIIGDALVGDLEDNELQNGIQRSKGFSITSKDYGVEVATWTVPYDMEITGLAFAQEDVRNMGYDDYINIYIDDELYFETIYLKEMQENKDFHSFIKVSKGSIIKIEYINDTGIEKEFNIDIEHINKETINVVIPNPPQEIEPEEPLEPEIELVPIYRVYMRYEGNTKADLDLYCNMFNNADGSDIAPNKTVGFSRRQWGINTSNIVTVPKVSDNHLGYNDRIDSPEILEIYGKPSRYFRLFSSNFKDGDKLTEEVTIEIHKLNSDGTDGLLLGIVNRKQLLFSSDNAKVNFFDFDIETESITEL